MANFFPRVALRFRGPNGRLIAFALAGLIGYFPLVLARSDTASAIDLKPYTARYITKAKGLSMTLDRKLVRKNNGGYELTNGGSKLIAGFNEVSHFRVENSMIVPESYVYQGTGLMNRRREIHFTPGSDSVRSFYKDNWYDLPYTENTFDRMSQQEQIRIQLMQNDTPQRTGALNVADGKRVKEYQLEFVAEETLSTPMGRIQTLHFERLHDDPDRKSDTWLAPDWDYLMVKTIHVDDGSPVEVNLMGGSVAGVALRGELD